MGSMRMPPLHQMHNGIMRMHRTPSNKHHAIYDTCKQGSHAKGDIQHTSNQPATHTQAE